MIVDAIFGIGLTRQVEGIYREAIQAINLTKIPVLAIDVPSGVEADTGGILGEAIRANYTVTFIGYKRGLFTSSALDYSGEVILEQLGIKVANDLNEMTYLMNKKMLRDALPKRQRNLHKGENGHVLIVGGNDGMAGAASLVAGAALRVGAGLVTVVTTPGNRVVINAHFPEIMCHALTESDSLQPFLTKASVMVLGPGLGQDAWAKRLFSQALCFTGPLVIDADGLNLLGGNPRCRDNWVLTPHPGEAARLLCLEHAKAIQANRFLAIQRLALLGGNWVLKGAGTLINRQETPIYLCPFGNPGMASGGMGDALSGVIAGLIAQKIEPLVATKIGVIAHALAGDQAASFGERGLLASDLIDQLRAIVNASTI